MLTFLNNPFYRQLVSLVLLLASTWPLMVGAGGSTGGQVLGLALFLASVGLPLWPNHPPSHVNPSSQQGPSESQTGSGAGK